MRIRFYNVRLLTMEPDRPIFWGELHVEDGKIIYVGEEREGACPEGREDAADGVKDETSGHAMQGREETGQKKWDRQIDGHGNLLMPGFKDAHTHSPMTFLRSAADDLPLGRWLNERVFPAESRLTQEAVYWFTRLAALEYASGGITAVFDMYAHKETVARALVDSGIRTVLCGHLNDFTGSVGQMEEDYLRYNADPDGMVSYRLGFHGEYTTSRQKLEQVADLADRFKAPVYTHCAETAKEVANCRSRTGDTPVAYLDRLGLFAHGGGLFHAVHVTQADIRIMAKVGLYAVTNPASNLKLASGIAPLSALDAAGVGLAIGTDGPASNNALDMFREMYLACTLAKVREMDPCAIPADRTLYMATVGGARCMGLPGCVTLSLGQKADLIMLDMHAPNMQPECHIEKNIVYSGSRQNVRMTLCNGRIIYEDGKWAVGEETEEIYRQARYYAGKIREV